MTPGIYDKPMMLDIGRWTSVPHIVDARGDRPVMTLADLLPAIPKDLSNPRKVQKP